MQEVWKDIKGYEGYYQISNLARCKSLKTGRILKPNKSFKYSRYSLYKEKKKDIVLIHRMVAETFIDNPLNLEIVNHIDEDKRNNRVDNLEWCTLIDNTRKYYHNEKLIGKFDASGNLLDVYKTVSEAGRSLDKKHNAISMCLNNSRKSAYGYVWEYV